MRGDSLREDLDCYRYLISREKPLSAIIHKPWSTACKALLQDGCRAWVKRTRGHDTSHAKFEAKEKDQGYTLREHI
jgi:hypothetical protein